MDNSGRFRVMVGDGLEQWQFGKRRSHSYKVVIKEGWTTNFGREPFESACEAHGGYQHVYRTRFGSPEGCRSRSASLQRWSTEIQYRRLACDVEGSSISAIGIISMLMGRYSEEFGRQLRLET